MSVNYMERSIDSDTGFFLRLRELTPHLDLFFVSVYVYVYAYVYVCLVLNV